jgi:hypothetical protein
LLGSTWLRISWEVNGLSLFPNTYNIMVAVRFFLDIGTF